MHKRKKQAVREAATGCQVAPHSVFRVQTVRAWLTQCCGLLGSGPSLCTVAEPLGWDSVRRGWPLLGSSGMQVNTALLCCG